MNLNRSNLDLQEVLISLVMIVRNEESTLARCLESVKEIVDEIVIVDTGSQDKTKEIAKSFGAMVYDFVWIDDFSEARNFALSKASYEYILVLDADEYIVSGGKKELQEVIHKKAIGKIALLDAFNNKGELGYSRNFISRIFPKGVNYVGSIHEQVESNLPRIKTNLQVAHDGYLHIDKSERNLAILFKALEASPEDSYILYQLAHTLLVAGRKEEALVHYEAYYKCSRLSESYRCAAVVDFIRNILELGSLENGVLVIEKEEKNYYDSPDFNFVCAEFYRELVLSDVKKYIGYLPLIEGYYIKCLEIGETTKYDSVVGMGSYLAAYNLGVWYEVTKQTEKARTCYEMAMEWGYEKAVDRIKELR